jgi:CDP-diacylglycerol--glycerol-3-phosphate 3-phosphatidyltransferase
MDFSAGTVEGFRHASGSPLPEEESVNLPNQLTLARLAITTVFAAVLEMDWSYRCTAGLLLFAVASLTDYADGAIARRYNLVTDFGSLMDPLVDKVLMATALICLSVIPYNHHPILPAWVSILIISREFLITGLRQIAVSKGVVLSADRWGKHKTIWQIIAILYYFLILSFNEWSVAGWFPALPGEPSLWSKTGWGVMGIALALTVWSGLSYLWRNRSLIADR